MLWNDISTYSTYFKFSLAKVLYQMKFFGTSCGNLLLKMSTGVESNRNMQMKNEN